jgi:multiple sugar transport system permease protein
MYRDPSLADRLRSAYDRGVATAAGGVAAARRLRRRHLLEERRVLAPLLIAPAVVAVLAVVGIPFGWAIYLSLTNALGGSLSGTFVGFDNFRNVWHDGNFRNALENTLIITFASQALVVIGAAILSHALVRDFRGKWLVRFLVVLPWAAPVALVTIAWLWIFDSLFSVLNWTLGKLHLLGAVCAAFGVGGCGATNPPQWLGHPKLAMFAIIIVHAWRVLPFAVIIFIAGLASIPTEVEDAARIDGATGLKKLAYVTLPLQLPIALVAVLFGIVFTAADFAVVFVLTHGGPFNSTQVLTTWAYQIGIESGSLGEGAAISLYLFPLLAAVTILMLFFAKRAQVS